MAISILCPGCSVRLSVPDAAAGANVGCPQCAMRMLVPLPTPVSAEKPRRIRPVAVREDDEDEEATRPQKPRESRDRSRRKKKKAADNTGIWIGVGVGGFIIAVTAVVAVILAQPPEAKPREDFAVGNFATGNPLEARPDTPAITAVSVALPAGWVKFRHPDGMFTVYAPGEPVRSRITAGMPLLQPTVPLKPGEIRTSIYEVHPKDEQTLLCSMSISLIAPDQMGFMQGMFAENSGGKSEGPLRRTATRNVTWGGMPTIEATNEMDLNKDTTQTSVVRSVLDGNKMYHFMLARENGAPTDAEITAFFDSFVPGK